MTRCHGRRQWRPTPTAARISARPAIQRLLVKTQYQSIIPHCSVCGHRVLRDGTGPPGARRPAPQIGVAEIAMIG